MQTLATVAVAALATILVMHFVRGGRRDAVAWAKWLVTGTGDASPVPPGVPGMTKPVGPKTPDKTPGGGGGGGGAW